MGMFDAALMDDGPTVPEVTQPFGVKVRDSDAELLSPADTALALAPVPDVATAIAKAGVAREIARLEEINELIIGMQIRSEEQDAEYTGLAAEAKRLGKIIKERVSTVYVEPEGRIKAAEVAFTNQISGPKDAIKRIKAKIKDCIDMSSSIETRFKQQKSEWLSLKQIEDAKKEAERRRIEDEMNAKIKAEAAALGIENFAPVSLGSTQAQAKTVARAATGGTSSTRKRWEFTVEDLDAVPAEYLESRSVDVGKVMAAIQAGVLGEEYLTPKIPAEKKIRAAINEFGLRNIAGLKITQIDAIVLRS